MQDNIEQLRKSYLFLITLVSVFTFPLAVFVSASSSEIILILYGRQWVDAANSLAILSYNAAFITLFTLTDALARAKGLVYSQFRRHLSYAIFALLGAILGSRFGINGVAVGLTGATFLMYLLNAQLALKITGASWLDFFGAQKIGLIFSFSIGSALFVSDQIALSWLGGNTLVVLIVKTLIALVVFLVTALLIPHAWYGNLKQPVATYLITKFPSVNWNMLVRMGVRTDA
jgi:PST family polysaccharide transporter